MDDYPRSASRFPHDYCYPRSLKPYFRPIVQVNKQWREVVLTGSPSFMVTRVVLSKDQTDPYEVSVREWGCDGESTLLYKVDYSRAELLLRDSEGSDIDFCAYFGWYLSGDGTYHEIQEQIAAFGRWMEAHILPLSHRVRQLMLHVPLPAIKTVLECATAHNLSWLRLRVLAFNPPSNTTRVEEISRKLMLDAPGLRYATFIDCYMEDWRTGDLHRRPSGDDQDQLASRRKGPPHTLSHLHIDTTWQYAPITCRLSSVLFTTLTKLIAIHKNRSNNAENGKTFPEHPYRI